MGLTRIVIRLLGFEEIYFRDNGTVPYLRTERNGIAGPELSPGKPRWN